MSRSSSKPPANAREIAQLAGVSVATVSRALNDLPKVAPATRARVLEVAKKSGYRPNRTLSALASNRFRPGTNQRESVVLLTRRKELSVIANTIRNFTNESERQNFDFQHIDTFAHPHPRTLCRMLYHRNICGIFLHHHAILDDYWSHFDFSPFSVVLLEEDLAETFPNFHHVRKGSFQSTARAIKHCQSLGYRRIGVVVVHEKHLRAQNARILASLSVVSQEMDSGAEAFILPGFDRRSQRACYGKFQRWIESSRIDVLLFQNSAMIQNLLPAPEFPYATLSGASGSLSGYGDIRPRLASQSIALMETLIRADICGSVKEAFEVVISPEWMEGQTLGRASDEGS